MLWSAREWARVKATGDDMVNMIHDATNDTEKWGPTGPQMEKICLAFNGGGAYSIIEELEWRIRHAKDSWRPCYKSLLVVDYLARNAKDDRLKLLSTFKSLLSQLSSSFYYTNAKGVDHGISVRERSKNLLELLSDPGLLQEEREKARLVKNHLDGGGSRGYGLRPGSRHPVQQSFGGYGGDSLYPHRDAHRSSLYHDETGMTFTSKERQELDDSIVAMKLQREEELRSGLSAQQLEEMYARQARERQRNASMSSGSPVQRREADEEYARRLQREIREHSSPVSQYQPLVRSDRVEALAATSTTTSNAPTTSVSPPKEEEKKPAFQLDDLFSAAPPTTTTMQDPFGVAPPPQYVNPWGGQPVATSAVAASGSTGLSLAPRPTNPWATAPEIPTPSSSPWIGATPSAPPAIPSSLPPGNPWGAVQTAPTSAPLDLWVNTASAPAGGATSYTAGDGLFSTPNAAVEGEGNGGAGVGQQELWNCLEGFAKQRPAPQS